MKPLNYENECEFACLDVSVWALYSASHPVLAYPEEHTLNGGTKRLHIIIIIIFNCQ